MGDLKTFLKNNWNWLLLALILFFGFYLRAYHIDYPVVGYHNMKEAHTLTEMRNMYEGGHYLVNERDYHKPGMDQPYGIHGDNFPLFSWLVVLLWKIFGISLTLARLVAILFALGSVIFTYLFIKKAFKNEFLALLSSFFTAILPILIFFGRQVQFDIVALFFMMGAVYFFWSWRKKPTTKNIILFFTFSLLTGLTKYPFLIIGLPIAFTFPWKRLHPKSKFFKKYGKQYLLAIPFALIFIFWWFYSKTLNAHGQAVNVSIFSLKNLSLYFSSKMWSAIYTYAITDNFTFFGLIFALLGFLFIIKKYKQPKYRFLVAWAGSYLIYAAMAPPQMKGHNYYQVPFAPLIAILIAYFIVLISNTLSSIPPKKFKTPLIISVVFLVLLLMYPSLKLSTTRQFDTQFYGLDMAGHYLNRNSQPQAKFFGSGHQDTGIIWTAHRKYIIAPTNLTQLKEYERKFNITWFFVYQWGINKYLNDPQIRDYISNNYHLEQFAFLKTQDQNQPFYFLLQKGGNFSLDKLNQQLSDKPIQTKTYQLTNRKVTLYYINT